MRRDAAKLSLLHRRGHRLPPIGGDGELSDAATAELLGRIVEAQSAIASAGLDPVDVMAVVTVRAQELTGADGAILEIRDGDELVYWSASGIAEDRIGLRVPVRGSLSGLCLERGRALRCNDSESDARVDRAACRAVGLRSMLVAPLRQAGDAVGVLKVVGTEPDAFGPVAARVLEHLCVLVGASIQRAFEHARLRDEAGIRLRRDEARQRHLETVAGRLRMLISSDALQAALQPIVRIADGVVIGCEALARFPPGHGLPTNQWFEDAARCAMSVDLELAAVAAALSRFGDVPAGAYLAINVSPETAGSEALPALLSMVDPARLVLEITEHTQVRDYATLGDRLLAFQARGMRIAIDDTGAGFSSLRHVLSLAPDIIKLDMSLVRGIDSRPRMQRMVAALRTFAEGTEATLVAEGVETGAELQALRAIGVECAQGFHLGRPDR